MKNALDRIAELEKEAEDEYQKSDREFMDCQDEGEIFNLGYIAGAKAQIEKMQEKLKADLIAKLEEQIQYSTSPSCTKGMELFIKSIKKWEVKENDR